MLNEIQKQGQESLKGASGDPEMVIQRERLNKRPDLRNDILEKLKELIKISVRRIKTAVRPPRPFDQAQDY